VTHFLLTYKADSTIFFFEKAMPYLWAVKDSYLKEGLLGQNIRDLSMSAISFKPK
jgi:hypothetical protein